MNSHGHIISLDGPNISFDQLGSHYKKNSQIVKTSIEKINQNIKKGTEKERKQLETAVKNLEDKVQSILQQKENQEEHDKVKEASKERQKAMMIAGKKFFTAREQIFADRSLSTHQKSQKEKELYENIQNNFLTLEEKQFFASMMKDNMVVLIHPNQIKESSLAKQLMLN